jgi:hypothetical protein
MSYSLRDYAKIKTVVSDEVYATEKGFIVKHHGPLHIIKYNRDYLNKDTEKTVGRFRSVLVNDDGKIICFAPPKSLHMEINELENWAPIEECSIEEICEGTMINMYWCELENDWEILTRSNIGARCKFNQDNDITFRYMFLDTLNQMKIEFEDFDKHFCYSFILQHPENKMVCPINEKKIILTNIFLVNGEMASSNEPIQVSRQSFLNQLHLYVKSPSLENILQPKVYELSNADGTNSWEYFRNLNNILQSYDFTGYMINYEGERIKYRNPEYEKIRYLKGNSTKIQYTYYRLRREGKVGKYLRYFPELNETFNILRSHLHAYTRNLFNSYRQCYIQKTKPVKEYPYQYKTHMYHLHQRYLNEYKSVGDYINMSKVVEYVNELEPARLMHIVNYQNKSKQDVTSDEEIIVAKI